MKILFIGDIVAKPGRNAVKEILPSIIQNQSVDLVIANAENIKNGRGATEETLKEMQAVGVDYFTGGDHIFWQRGFEEVIDYMPVVRPANYPEPCPGKGYHILESNNTNILIINVMGRTSFGGLNCYLDDPMKKVDEILEKTADEKIDFTLVDFHAEATGEKHGFAFYLDGRVDAVLGTHTHVPTCDHRVLPNGTYYVSDVGMSGIIDSSLGVKKDLIIDQMLTARHQRFVWEDTGTKAFRSVIIDTDKKSIERIDRVID